MFNKYGWNYLIINSTPRGTEVNNVVFLRWNYVPQEFPFFFLLQPLGYFQTTEKMGLKKVNSYLKKGLALAKATVFPVHSINSVRANITLTLYLPLLRRESIFYHNSSSYSNSQVMHIAKRSKLFLFEGNWTDCFTLSGTKKGALCHCTGDKTVIWARLTLNSSQDGNCSTTALCWFMPNLFMVKHLLIPERLL